MTAWPLLELSLSSVPAQSRGDGQTDVAALRRHLLDAETAIIELNRQITDAIVSKRATGGLAMELQDIIEARAFMKSRPIRLEGQIGTEGR